MQLRHRLGAASGSLRRLRVVAKAVVGVDKMSQLRHRHAVRLGQVVVPKEAHGIYYATPHGREAVHTLRDRVASTVVHQTAQHRATRAVVVAHAAHDEGVGFAAVQPNAWLVAQPAYLQPARSHIVQPHCAVTLCSHIVQRRNVLQTLKHQPANA